MCLQIYRVQTQSWKQSLLGSTQLNQSGPVVCIDSVDNHAPHTLLLRAFEHLQAIGIKRCYVEMTVGIDQFHGSALAL